MNIIVFLIIWMPMSTPDSLPTARFIKTFDTLKECNVVRDTVKDVSLKPHLACVQMVAEPLKDAGGII